MDENTRLSAIYKLGQMKSVCFHLATEMGYTLDRLEGSTAGADPYREDRYRSLGWILESMVLGLDEVGRLLDVK